MKHMRLQEYTDDVSHGFKMYLINTDTMHVRVHTSSMQQQLCDGAQPQSVHSHGCAPSISPHHNAK